MEEERRDSYGRPEGIGSRVWMKLALDRINDNSSTVPEAKAGYMETDAYGLIDLMTGIWDIILLPQWREEVTSWEERGRKCCNLWRTVRCAKVVLEIKQMNWKRKLWQDVWAASTKRSLQICGQICKPKTLSMPVDFASATSAAWEMERLLYAGLGFGLENTGEWVKDTSCVCKRMTTTMNLRTHMLDKEVDEEGGWQCKKSGQWVGGL